MFVMLLSLSFWATGIALAQDGAAAKESETASTLSDVQLKQSSPSVVAKTLATYDTGSTAWLMISTALVFFMMPGLALFYGGMVRSKNLLNLFMCVMVCVPLIAVQWVAFGYSLAFAVPSAIVFDGGKNDDGSEKPKLSVLGWDPGLVGLKSFSEVTPIDGANSYGKILTRESIKGTFCFIACSDRSPGTPWRHSTFDIARTFG